MLACLLFVDFCFLLAWNPAESHRVSGGGHDVNFRWWIRLARWNKAYLVGICAIAVVGHTGEDGLVVLRADIVQLQDGVVGVEAAGHRPRCHDALTPGTEKKTDDWGNHDPGSGSWSLTCLGLLD